MLRKVTLRNFMCFADKTVDFTKRTTIISAKNGKGKTSVATAILWGLFNKNYELKDNPVVRNTAVSEKSDVEVELVFDDVTFRKVQKRKRSDKNPAEYADTNSYYINEVPCTMKEYNERIGSDIKTLLMGVSVNSFLSEKADVLRAFLFSHVEDVTDLDVAKSNSELSGLVGLLEKYKLEEVGAMNKKIVSDSTKDAVVLEGQIKERERDVALAQEIDVAELELQRNSINEQIAAIEAKIEDSNKLLEDRQKASDGIMELKFKLSDMERKANEDIVAKRKEIEGNIRQIDSKVETAQRDKIHYETTKRNIELSIETQLKKIKDLQEKWKAEKGRVFDESSLVCPYCGQEYQEDKKNALMGEFEAHKAEELMRITFDGETENDKLKQLREDLTSVLENITKSDKDIEVFGIEKKTFEHQLEDLKPVDITTTPEYIALSKEIAEKEQAMNAEYSADNARSELKSQIAQLISELNTISAQIMKANTEESEKRLEELLEQSRTLEQNKADAERILDLVDELEKAKNLALSEKVNSMFKVVKFELFEINKSGGYKNVCIPTIDGKSLLSNEANKALRLIGRLDICDAIQRLEKFDLPIILDDGEAFDGENLSKLETMTDKQLVILRVSDDAELQIG